MNSDNRDPLIKVEMESSGRLNGALGSVDVPISFPDDILGGGVGTGSTNSPALTDAIPSASATAPINQVGNRIVKNGEDNSKQRSDVDGSSGVISPNAAAVAAVVVNSSNFVTGPGPVPNSAPPNMNFGTSDGMVVDENAKFANSRMTNANFAMFPSYMQAHSLMDPSIQESLSPFFQPFGVDSSHFPMTNPPIFQSALATDSFNPRRRRISISNGQIGQLGEDEDNVESIYYSQPPPMPPMRSSQMQTNNSRVKMESLLTHGNSNNNDNSNSNSNSNSGNGNDNRNVSNSGNNNNNSDGRSVAYNMTLGVNSGNFAPSTSQLYASKMSFQQLQQESKSFGQSVEEPPAGPMTREFGQNSAYAMEMSTQGSDASSVKSNGSHKSSDRHALPGTAAWKRARLLERNRIAASKCRQRKKIAQEQLQKDVVVLKNSNKIMKSKLEFYQKLVTKFKRFMELHMESCGGNKDGLTMIEEMLKIDHDLQQDDQGNLVKSNSSSDSNSNTNMNTNTNTYSYKN